MLYDANDSIIINPLVHSGCSCIMYQGVTVLCGCVCVCVVGSETVCLRVIILSG